MQDVHVTIPKRMTFVLASLLVEKTAMGLMHTNAHVVRNKVCHQCLLVHFIVRCCASTSRDLSVMSFVMTTHHIVCMTWQRRLNSHHPNPYFDKSITAVLFYLVLLLNCIVQRQARWKQLASLFGRFLCFVNPLSSFDKIAMLCFKEHL